MMKLDPTTPRRLDEGQPTKLQRLIRRSRRRRPSAETTSRMAARLASAGAFATGPSPSSAPSAILKAGGARTRALALVIGSGALAIVALGGAWGAWGQPGADRTADVSIVPSATGRAGGGVAPPPLADESVAAPASVGTPVVAVDELPSARPGLAAPTSARPEVRPTPSPVASRGEGEFAIIKRAQDAVLSDPARALEIAEDHARAFPTGELVQEREVVVVEALVRLGRKADAASRADALVTRHPRTPYVVRLERALGEPLSPALPTSGR